MSLLHFILTVALSSGKWKRENVDVVIRSVSGSFKLDRVRAQMALCGLVVASRSSVCVQRRRKQTGVAHARTLGHARARGQANPLRGTLSGKGAEAKCEKVGSHAFRF